MWVGGALTLFLKGPSSRTIAQIMNLGKSLWRIFLMPTTTFFWRYNNCIITKKTKNLEMHTDLSRKIRHTVQKKSGDEYEDKRKRKWRTKRQDYSIFLHWQFFMVISQLGISMIPLLLHLISHQCLVRLCTVCSRTTCIIAREYQPAGLAPAILFRTISFKLL